MLIETLNSVGFADGSIEQVTLRGGNVEVLFVLWDLRRVQLTFIDCIHCLVEPSCLPSFDLEEEYVDASRSPEFSRILAKVHGDAEYLQRFRMIRFFTVGSDAPILELAAVDVVRQDLVKEAD